MKFIVGLILSITISITAYSQVVGGHNKKLAELYNDANYEMCLFKADDMTYKEGTSNDPEPYLYVAMCFYQLSNSDDIYFQEDYKDGLKQAVKYIGKFVKKDKDGEMYQDNLDFINIIKGEQFIETKKNFDKQDYKKAAIDAKAYEKMIRGTDYPITYFIGMCENMSNNSSMGIRDIDKAKEGIFAQEKQGEVNTDAIFKPLVVSGFLKYSEYLVGQNDLEGAVKALNHGLKIFPGNGFIKAQSNMISSKLNSGK